MLEAQELITIADHRFARTWSGRKTTRPGVTLVAFYGLPKPQEIEHLLELAVHNIPAELPGWLEPMPRRQVHGTIIGLEGRRQRDGSVIHENLRHGDVWSRDASSDRAIDFSGLLAYLRGLQWPITIQFGGVGPDTVNPQDPVRRPFERLFSVHDNGLVVAIGWPVGPDGVLFQPLLARLRKDVEYFNVVHKYHVSPEDWDNDFFMVLGSLNLRRWGRATHKERRSVLGWLSRYVDQVRAALAPECLTVELARERLQVVAYRDAALSRTTFCKPVSEVSADELRSLY